MSAISSSRFRSERVESSSDDDPVYRCFEADCADSVSVVSRDLLTECARMRCSSSSSSTKRTTHGDVYHLSFVPVGIPCFFHPLPTVLCPASSTIDNEILRYCTSGSCYGINSEQLSEGKTEYERVERIGGSRCLRMCSDPERGRRRYEECVRQECCFEADASNPPPPPPPLPQQLTRRRRVNDDVSQCIQSYCSGYSVFRERILCILKNCNRPVLSS